MAVTWGLGGAGERASRYRSVMTLPSYVSFCGDVSDVIAAFVVPVFLVNHFKYSDYLIGYAGIVLTRRVAT